MLGESNKKPIFHVSDNDVGQRLDNYLMKHCKQLDKSSCYKLIRKGQIRVNGKRSKPLQKLQTGDLVRVPPFLYFVEPESLQVSPQLIQALKAAVLYEDDDYLVLNKPAGLPVHAGTGHQFGVIEIINSQPHYKHVQLAHRLDKDTSGCLLLAKNRLALIKFQALMKKHEVEKSYLAVLSGQLMNPVKVDQPLDSSHRVNGIRHVVVSPAGKSAETTFTPIKRQANLTLVQCNIKSGRTHQIRVHAKHLGFPVLGDHFYGGKKHHSNRQLFLHAHELSFAGQTFTASSPHEFEQVMAEH